MLKLSSFASRLELPVSSQFLSGVFLDLHDAMNPREFDREVSCPSGFEPFVRLVYSAMKQSEPAITSVRLGPRKTAGQESKKVLLGLSGGLDSVAQAVLLSKEGYDVIPYEMENANFYSNGQEHKACEEVCSKLGLKLVTARFIRCSDKDNPHRKYHSENPIKNQMILATMADWCLENGARYVSLGDDFDLKLVQAVPGVNLTDAEEVTKSFLEGLSGVIEGLSFIPMRKGFNKLARIRLLDSVGLLDSYYSCVGPGRLNRSQHERYEKKFGIRLPGRNCASCRKCCHHLLLMHYGGYRTIPDALVERCWEKCGAEDSADKAFFGKDIPLEKRIRNLFEY